MRLPTLAAVGAAVVAACLLSGCGTAVTGRAMSINDDPLNVGGMPAITGPSGPRAGALGPSIVPRGADGSKTDHLAAAAVEDIQSFWDTEFPKHFKGRAFEKVRYLQSWDSQAPTKGGEKFCGTPTASFLNAAYCPKDNTIGWDRGVLMPALIDSFGPMAMVMVLAHEFGHSIQRQGRIVSAGRPGIVFEQQADCLGGVFIRQVAEGRASHFTLDTTKGLNSVLAATVSVRDADSTDPESIHGSAFERVTAVQMGFADGVEACTRIDEREIDRRRANLPQRHQGNPDNPREQLAITRDNLEAFVRGLRAVLPVRDAPTVDYGRADTGCADARVTLPVSYCPSNNTIGVDLRALAERGRPPRAPKGGLPLTVTGDYTAFVEFGSRYTLALQRAAGKSLKDAEAALRTACLSGVFTASFSPRNTKRVARRGDFILTPADLDKAVSGLLTDGLAASDVDGNTVPSGFARIDAFRWGVLHNQESCNTHYR